MNRFTQKQNAFRARQRKGAMLVLIVIMLIAFLMTVAFTVDIAHMHLTRTELRTATDAAAKAAAFELSRTEDTAAAISLGRDIALKNAVAGDGLILQGGDFDFGRSEQLPSGRFEFQSNGFPPNSVSVDGRRTLGSPGGAVPLFFGNVMGVEFFEPVQNAISAASSRDIALVLDISGSMSIRDAGGGLTRNQALIRAVIDFINVIESNSSNSNISLTTYSTNARRVLPLSSDLSQVRASAAGLGAGGLTNIFQGIRFGSDSLEQDPNRREFAERTIVVMTDGNFNEGGNPTPSARLAADRGHVIHTVTFSRGANQAIMRQVANIGTGLHFHADDAGDLSEAFKEIARTISVILVK